jgi:hypothetical protein
MKQSPYCKYYLQVYSEVVLNQRQKQGKVNNMNTSNHLYRDVMTGLLFLTGIVSFISGEFVFSTLLFGTASLTSHLDFAKPARA